MSGSRGQSQLDWFIGFIAFFIFLTVVVTLPQSPLFIAGYYDNNLEMDAQTTAEWIAYDTLRNGDGEITHEKINSFISTPTNDVDKYIISSENLNSNITIKNADNPAGEQDETGKEPIPLRGNTKNKIGQPIPQQGVIKSASVTVSVDERPVIINVRVWRE